MTTKQLTPIRGVAAEFFLMDCGELVEVGTPVLQIDQWVNLSLTEVYEDGTEISLRDQKGRPIVHEESPGYLARIDVAIEFGGIDPLYAAYLTGDRIDAVGTGAGIGRREGLPPTFLMRVWQELPGQGRVFCDSGEQEYVVHWLPIVTNFRRNGGALEMSETSMGRYSMTAQAYPGEDTFGNGPDDEYVFSDRGAEGGFDAGAAYPGEIHLYHIASDIAPPTFAETVNAQMAAYTAPV